MFGKILFFELRYQFRRPSFYICLAAAMVVAFLLVTALAEAAGDERALLKFNAPIVAAQFVSFAGFFTLLIPLVMFGRTAMRDVDAGTEEVVRATPAPLAGLLLARFTATFVLVTLVYVTLVPSAELALRMPWIDAELVGPFRLGAYAQTYALMTLPNIFIFGSAAFVAASWTRSMASAYALCVLFVGLIVAIIQTGLRDTSYLGPLIDPFGMAALGDVSRYWSTAERNVNPLPVEGVLLWNRLIWVSLGVVLLAGTALFLPRSVKGGHSKIIERTSRDELFTTVSIPNVPPGGAPAMRQLLLRLGHETGGILRGWTFPFMLLTLAAICLATLQYPDKSEDIPFLPVTVLIAPKVSEMAASWGAVIIILLTGEAMWRERERRISEIIDAAPVANIVLLAGKLGALTAAGAISLLVASAAGAGFQASRGLTTEIEPAVYAASMVFNAALPLLMLTVLAMLMHTMMPNKYAGHLAMLGFVAISGTAYVFGIEDGLVQFAAIPKLPLSVMNGFGHYLETALWFVAYWGGVTILLAVATQLLWPRGVRVSLVHRIRSIPTRMTRGTATVAACAFLLSVIAGGVIYWNTHILNAFYTTQDYQRASADYERSYSAELRKPQPRVVQIDMAVDIDPDNRILKMRGRYGLINRSKTPIDAVRVQFSDDVKVDQIVLERAKLSSQEPYSNDYVFIPDVPLAPAETLTLTFAGTFSSAGFQHRESAVPINENGTSVHNIMFAPWIGVQPHLFVMDRVRRRELGLPALELAEHNGLISKDRNFLAPDSDFVRFGITLSTSPDQTAVAPGILKKEWVEGGRRYFRYESDGPIVNFWSILSARYATARAAWRNVGLAVHHHPSQGQNVSLMLAAMQHSLDYYTKTFGPFPHSQLRIAEFPYAAMAQSFPTTIAYAETLGFVADGSVGGVDYVSFVTAHEVAHQWWGHQAVPADMPGAQMLSETLAEYSALMVMERLYGHDRIRAYLKFDLDHYLSQRGLGDAEQPLAKVRLHQAHIAYKKGALAMYALREAIGQEAMDRALRRYLENYRNAGAPYPTAGDFLTILREEAGADHQALIADLFEYITLWDFKIYQADATPTDDGKWKVSVTVGGKKFYADESGAEQSAPLYNTADIGLFAADPSKRGFTSRDVIVLEKRLLSGTMARFDFVTDRKPAFAGVNPYLKLIERKAQDNIIAVR